MTEGVDALRADFESAHGYWSESFADIARLDPTFFRSYLELSTVPARTDALDPKTRALVGLAIDANATHMFVPGIRRHMAQAVELGAPVACTNEVTVVSAVSDPVLHPAATISRPTITVTANSRVRARAKIIDQPPLSPADAHGTDADSDAPSTRPDPASSAG